MGKGKREAGIGLQGGGGRSGGGREEGGGKKKNRDRIGPPEGGIRQGPYCDFVTVEATGKKKGGRGGMEKGQWQFLWSACYSMMSVTAFAAE